MKRLTLLICVVVLCGGSLLCSVGLWSSEQSSLFTQILFGAFFGALELCKFAFFPIAFELFSTRKVTGTLLYLLGFVLLVFSIFATVAYLETGATVAASSARQNSHSYAYSSETIASLEAQIKTVSDNMASDSQYGYRARAAQQAALLRDLNQQKFEAINSINDIQVNDYSGVQSIFSKLSSTLSVEQSSLRLLVYTLLAIFIDVCGIACLIVLSIKPATKKQKQPVKKRSQEQLIKSVELVAETPKKSESIEAIKERIVSGEYGDKPIARDIKDKERVGYSKVKKAFSELVDEGLVHRLPKGFQLTTALNN